MKLWLLVGFIMLVSFAPIQAQDECNINLANINTFTNELNQAVNSGDMDAALSIISEIQAELSLIESQCVDYAPENAGDSRTNPVPFGQRQHVTIFDDVSGFIEVTDYIDDADAYIAEAGRFNAEPDPGMHYVVIEILFSCERSASESCQFSPLDYNIVGRNGVVYDTTLFLDGVTEMTEIFGGTEITATIAFIVEDGDSDFVMFNAFDDRVYFAAYSD